MRIFLSHSTNYDYKKELYYPIIKKFKNTDREFFLPEEHHINTKLTIKSCDIFIAEVSHGPSTGMGIEIGWADAFNKPIICFYKEGTKISNSIKYLTQNIFSYNDKNIKLVDLIEEKLSEIIPKQP